MYFSDLSVGLKIFAVALWLALFLAGMALIAWALSSFLFALPYEALLLLGGVIVGFVIGGLVSERFHLLRYAPEVWAAMARDLRFRLGLLAIPFGTIGLIFLAAVLFKPAAGPPTEATTTTLSRTP